MHGTPHDLPATVRRTIRRFVGLPTRPDAVGRPIAVHGHVRVTTYRMADVRRVVPAWDSLGREAKLAALGRVPIATRTETANTTLADLHEYLVDHLDPNQSPTAIDASHLALGTDATDPSVSDTGLGAEQYREAVDSTTDAGNDLETTTLLDENEGNGFTYEELGLVSASSGGTFLNHSNISSTPKTSENTATFEVVLQFRAA